MKLAGEEQDRDRNDKKQPETVSTHLFGKTKLRQERLAGQAIRSLTGGRTSGSYFTSARNG